ERIAAVKNIIKIDHVKRRFDFVAGRELEQCIIGDLGKIIVFKIVEEHAEPFPDMLGDNVANNEIRLPSCRCTDHKQCPERVDKVYPASADAALECVLRRKVYRIFILQKSLLLRKGFIQLVEDVISQMKLYQS